MPTWKVDITDQATSPTTHTSVVTVHVGRRKWAGCFTTEEQVGAFLIRIARELGAVDDEPPEKYERLRRLIDLTPELTVQTSSIKFIVDASFVPFLQLRALWQNRCSDWEVRRRLEVTPFTEVRRRSKGRRLWVQRDDFTRWWQSWQAQSQSPGGKCRQKIPDELLEKARQEVRGQETMKAEIRRKKYS